MTLTLDSHWLALDLSVRPSNAIRRLGIDTVGQLVGFTAAELLELRNFADTSLKEVRHKLAVHGFALRGDRLPQDATAAVGQGNSLPDVAVASEANVDTGKGETIEQRHLVKAEHLREAQAIADGTTEEFAGSWMSHTERADLVERVEASAIAGEWQLAKMERLAEAAGLTSSPDVPPRYLATWVNRTADLTAHLNEIAATGYRLVTMCAAEVQVTTDQGVRWAMGVRCTWEREGER